MKLDFVFGEHRIVALDRADVVDAGNISRGQNRDDAGRSAHRIEIELRDPPARGRRAADGDVQRSFRLADVVDIDCVAADMANGGIVTSAARIDAQRRLLQSCVSGLCDIGHLANAGDTRLIASVRRRFRSTPCSAARPRCGVR